MTITDSIRKALMAGLGVQEKLKELVEDLVKKGELNESQAAKLIKEWTNKMGKSGEELSKSISDLVSKTLEKMNIPTRDELERLNKKVQSLSARLKKYEESREGEETLEE